MVLYVFLGAVASLFSSMKIVQTRRKLQAQKNYKVSFTEALVHTVFDTVDRFSAELQHVNRVIEQRRLNSPQLQSIGYYGNDSNNRGSATGVRGNLLALPSNAPSAHQPSPMLMNNHQRPRSSNRDDFNDPAIESIPNNRIGH